MHGNIVLKFIDAASIFIVLIKHSVSAKYRHMFPGFKFYQPYGIICEVGSNAEASDISPQRAHLNKVGEKMEVFNKKKEEELNKGTHMM